MKGDETIKEEITAIGVNICVITRAINVRNISTVCMILSFMRPIFSCVLASAGDVFGLDLLNTTININNNRYNKYARDGGP